MPADTYEHDVQPVRGDVLLDRVLGWLCFACALPVFGFAIYRLANPLGGSEPQWVQPIKVVLVALGLIGIYTITTSKPAAFRVAIWLYAMRLISVVLLYPWSAGPRFWTTEVVWNLVVLGYCWLRLKSIRTEVL